MVTAPVERSEVRGHRQQIGKSAALTVGASKTQGTRERFATEMAMHETVQAAAAMAALQATLREHRKCVEFDSQETLSRACDLLSTILTANSTRIEM
jgi:hypothetical protein